MTITLQPSEYTDHITGDGTELTKLPYPLHVERDGTIGRQDFWKGNPSRVIGFTRDVAAQRIDLLWADVVDSPQQAVGTYVVVVGKDGRFSTLVNAIKDVRVREGS